MENNNFFLQLFLKILFLSFVQAKQQTFVYYNTFEWAHADCYKFIKNIVMHCFTKKIFSNKKQTTNSSIKIFKAYTALRIPDQSSQRSPL